MKNRLNRARRRACINSSTDKMFDLAAIAVKASLRDYSATATALFSFAGELGLIFKGYDRWAMARASP